MAYKHNSSRAKAHHKTSNMTIDKDISNAQSDSEAGNAIQAQEATQHVKTRQAPTLRAEYQLFAEKLNTIMIRAGITPSEAARRIWGTTNDKRGYAVARNRDRIGHYLKGTSYPGPENMRKLAEALGVPVEALAVEPPTRLAGGRPQSPVPGAFSAARSQTPVSGLLQTTMPANPADTNMARFQADRMISPALAIALMQMIVDDDKQRAAGVEVGAVIEGGKTASGTSETRTAREPSEPARADISGETAALAS